MNPAPFINEIVSRRKEIGLTQAELAKRAMVSRRMITSLEAGEHDIGLRRLLRILGALDLHLTLRPGLDRPTEETLKELFKDDDE